MLAKLLACSAYTDPDTNLSDRKEVAPIVVLFLCFTINQNYNI